MQYAIRVSCLKEGCLGSDLAVAIEPVLRTLAARPHPLPNGRRSVPLESKLAIRRFKPGNKALCENRIEIVWKESLDPDRFNKPLNSKSWFREPRKVPFPGDSLSQHNAHQKFLRVRDRDLAGIAEKRVAIEESSYRPCRDQVDIAAMLPDVSQEQREWWLIPPRFGREMQV